MRESKQSKNTPDESNDAFEHPEEEPFLTASMPPKISPVPEHDPGKDSRPLHELLPFDGDLPEIPHMPFITHTGEYLHIDDRHDLRDKYVPYFRKTIGGCSSEEAEKKRWARELRTDDLFCLPGLDVEYVEASGGEDDEEEESSQVDEVDEEQLQAQKIAEAIVLGTQGNDDGSGPTLQKLDDGAGPGSESELETGRG